MTKYQKNFNKTLELIKLCFDLKMSYIQSKYPSASERQIKDMIYRQVIDRKQKQWKLHADS